MSAELIVMPSNELLDDNMHNPYDRGWHFGSGDPELHHYIDRLIVPGGDVLDVGIGYGRNAFFFALHGMNVVGVDENAEAVRRVNETAALVEQSIPFSLTAHKMDALTANFPENTYDVALAANMIHMPSRQATFDVLDKTYAALKDGGHMWLRLAGVEASMYEEMLYASTRPSEVRAVGEGVFEHPCGCSGEYRMDPSVFFEQTSVLAHFAELGARIVHNQLAPTDDQHNIMFAEDFRTERYVAVGGMISMLVQKTGPSV